MYRKALDYLKEWKGRTNRKPLIIRGARQTGKTFLARIFAKESFDNIVEINFERNPEYVTLFDANSPDSTISMLEVQFNTSIKLGKTLIFLDEIQAAPSIFAKLRYFFEEKPELHIIAAGSLLDFVLEDHNFSMPVGRIEYLYLEPMSFEEFLIALDKINLHNFLLNYNIGSNIPESIHLELINLLKQYLIIGGMPQVVDTFINSNSFLECDIVKQSILSTYQDDFSKYGKRVNHVRLQKVFSKVPLLVGQKIKYINLDGDGRAKDISESLHQLFLAKVITPVYHTASNGIPLGAEVDEKRFKLVFLDVGLLCKACGLSAVDIVNTSEVTLVNSGSVSEQFIGQQLKGLNRFFEEPKLYYWIREKKNSNAEVDYVISEGENVVPIEVKAGKTGRLKSIHIFLKEKNRNFAIRFNSDVPSIVNESVKLPSGEEKTYKLLSLPLYMVGQVNRIC